MEAKKFLIKRFHSFDQLKLIQVRLLLLINDFDCSNLKRTFRDSPPYYIVIKEND